MWTNHVSTDNGSDQGEREGAVVGPCLLGSWIGHKRMEETEEGEGRKRETESEEDEAKGKEGEGSVRKRKFSEIGDQWRKQSGGGKERGCKGKAGK